MRAAHPAVTLGSRSERAGRATVAPVAIFESFAEPAQLDAEVRSRLAHSLTHIAERAGDRLEIDPEVLEAVIERIRANRQDPGIFARYFDLVFALNRADFAQARALFGEIAERARRPRSFAILPYDREALGADYERFPRLLFAEQKGDNPMISPEDQVFRDYRDQLADAMEIVRRVDPGIHREITDLLLLVCVSRARTDGSTMAFGGCTSLMVWGASFVNLDSYRARWESPLFFVHEITHAMLFGVSVERPLVLNDPQLSYNSPLRAEPRPMDGIYHAVIVLARMTQFCRMWLDLGELDGADREGIERTAQRTAGRFEGGLETVREHGELSDIGCELLDQACRAAAITP